MDKKSSSLVDLRLNQLKRVKNKSYKIDTNIKQELGSLADFDIPITIDEYNYLNFDLPLDITKYNTDILDDKKIVDIEFIPRSAKNYNKYKHKHKKISLNIRSLNYITKSSFYMFLSLCILMLMSIPSLNSLNNAFIVKDNLLLQASASEKLLNKTNIDNFLDIKTSLDEISNGIKNSSEDISDIQGNLKILLSILPGLSIIQDASELTTNTADIISLTGELSEAISPFISKEINPFDTNKQITLVDGIKKIKEVNTKLIPALDNLSNSLDKFPINLIPGDKGNILRQLNNDIPKLRQILVESEPYIDVFMNFVGSDILKRYVFIFQNNQELRATGGFIGSFGMMDIDKGVVKGLDIKEIYNPDGQLLKQVLAPQPLQELTNKWYLRDSNWFADFPTSAQKIISFYEKTGGATPDGVISLTPTVIERLLLITGPITLDKYGITINNDNFLKITQYQTGVAYDKVENKPKQFIADLAPILINKLLSSNASQYQKIIEVLNNSFQEKHILLYFLDANLQNIVNKYNLGGQLYDAPKDYLSIVHSNIGGYKTDGVMQESLNISTKLQDNGKVVNKLTVNREHKGGATEYEWWNKDNINYMRVYIPKGAKIINVSGYTDREEKQENQGVAGYNQDKDLKFISETFYHNEDWDIDTFEESGKFVIGGWIITKPGDSSQVMIEYELPFKFKSYDVYSLILQKQAGTLGVKYNYNFENSKKNRVIWQKSSFNGLKQTKNGYEVIDGLLKTDEYIGVQIK